jgi:hypothetical protein
MAKPARDPLDQRRFARPAQSQVADGNHGDFRVPRSKPSAVESEVPDGYEHTIDQSRQP